MIVDVDQYKTIVGFSYDRLRDTLLLYANLSDNAHGVREAAYLLLCLMEDIQEEDLKWTFQQAMAYLSAVSITRRIYRRKIKFYSMFEYGRDSTYMLFSNAFGSRNFNPLIDPVELHSSILLELMDEHDQQYDKVLYAIVHLISNGDDNTKPFVSVPVIRKSILQNIEYTRASKVHTHQSIQSHAALCYALSLFH